MCKISGSLYSSLRRVLSNCEEFHSPRQISSIFLIEDLRPWRDGLPEANNLRERVDLIISYLASQRRSNGENVLVLFLLNLSKRYDPNDERHRELKSLASQIEMPSVSQNNKPESKSMEANPSAAAMSYILENEKIQTCAHSVALVGIPRFVEGKQETESTGTAWLITPYLALTCRHVIESLYFPLEVSRDPDDLQKQVANTLLTFDYVIPGNGSQYRVSALEYPVFDSQSLDYAILRIIDRKDAPLSDRGYLQIDPDAQLTIITSLGIIQHPLGQPQKIAFGNFKRRSNNPGCILYNTPTGEGTSGAPVINTANFRVVALHIGENDSVHLREGLLLSNILSDLKEHKMDLYKEIVDCQNGVV